MEDWGSDREGGSDSLLEGVVTPNSLLFHFLFLFPLILELSIVIPIAIVLVWLVVLLVVAIFLCCRRRQNFLSLNLFLFCLHIIFF